MEYRSTKVVLHQLYKTIVYTKYYNKGYLAFVVNSLRIYGIIYSKKVFRIVKKNTHEREKKIIK